MKEPLRAMATMQQHAPGGQTTRTGDEQTDSARENVVNGALQTLKKKGKLCANTRQSSFSGRETFHWSRVLQTRAHSMLDRGTRPLQESALPS
jgi:hypothetical protein